MSWYHVAKTITTVVSGDVLADSEEEAMAIFEGDVDVEPSRIANEDIMELDYQISAEQLEPAA